MDGGKGGGDKSQIDTAVRSLVRWVREYVDYLPGKTPEAFIWDNMDKRTPRSLNTKSPIPRSVSTSLRGKN